jgi:hypothetical protein
VSKIFAASLLLGAHLAWGANAGRGTATELAPRQRCEPALRSALWPGDANAHPKIANQYAREGRLWICTQTRQGLRWEQIAITFKQLTSERRPPRPNLVQ